MLQDRNRSAMTNALVAIAAGCAGALLFLLASRGTYAGMVLSYFAPLPLMIATIGFGVAVGGAAAIAGAFVAGALAHPTLGLAVFAGLFLPAWLTCVAGVLAPADPPNDRRAPRVLLVCVLFAAGSAAAGVLALTLSYGDFATARRAMIEAALPLIRTIVQTSRLPGSLTPEELARALVAVAPAIVAASSLVMLALNAYVAARVAAVSGQLRKPWPAVADTLALPPLAGAVLAIACGLTFVGGLTGMLASIVAAATGAGFALQGLAVIHVRTRAIGGRAPLLAGLYVIVLCVPPWPLLLLAVVGFLDAAFHLRRPASGPTPKP